MRGGGERVDFEDENGLIFARTLVLVVVLVYHLVSGLCMMILRINGRWFSRKIHYFISWNGNGCPVPDGIFRVCFAKTSLCLSPHPILRDYG